MKQKQKVKNNIILTGGHAGTTALAVSEELIRRSGKKYNWDIYWIGPKYAMEGEKIPTLASIALPKKGVTFHTIITGRLQRKFTKWTLVSFLKTPLGLLHALYLINKIEPDIILSFGGYASFPIVIIGWLLRIPILFHDQTYSFNRSTRLTSFFAKKILVSRKKSLEYYPKDKIVITGNPLMTQILDVKPKYKLSDFSTIYITGGSTGAKAINSLIKKVLVELLKENFLIHQTGYLDYNEFLEIRNRLSEKLRDNYEVYKFIDPMQVDGIYKRADIIISRAGANTVSEIITTKRPAILIPLVIGRHDEQRKNAIYAEKFGIAKVLDQDKITEKILIKEIDNIKKNYTKIVEKVKNKQSPDIQAAVKVVNIIEGFVK